MFNARVIEIFLVYGPASAHLTNSFSTFARTRFAGLPSEPSGVLAIVFYSFRRPARSVIRAARRPGLPPRPHSHRRLRRDVATMINESGLARVDARFVNGGNRRAGFFGEMFVFVTIPLVYNTVVPLNCTRRASQCGRYVAHGRSASSVFPVRNAVAARKTGEKKPSVSRGTSANGQNKNHGCCWIWRKKKKSSGSRAS